MLLKAKFIGQDGSMGFKKGEDYNLFLFGNIIIEYKSKTRCPYGSVESFLKNWRIIEEWRHLEVKGFNRTKPLSAEDTRKFLAYVKENDKNLTDRDRKNLLKMAETILRNHSSTVEP